jgi:hypothetical protein
MPTSFFCNREEDSLGPRSTILDASDLRTGQESIVRACATISDGEIEGTELEGQLNAEFAFALHDALLRDPRSELVAVTTGTEGQALTIELREFGELLEKLDPPLALATRTHCRSSTLVHLPERSKKGYAIPVMNEVLLIGGFIAAWVVLQVWVLPRLGVSS